MQINSDQVFEVAFMFVARHFSAQRAQEVKPVLQSLVEMFGHDIHFISGNANQINFRVSGLTASHAFQKLKSGFGNPGTVHGAYEFYRPNPTVVEGAFESITSVSFNGGGEIRQHKPIKGGYFMIELNGRQLTLKHIPGGGTIFEHKPITRF